MPRVVLVDDEENIRRYHIGDMKTIKRQVVSIKGTVYGQGTRINFVKSISRVPSV